MVSRLVVSNSLQPPWTVLHQAPLSMGILQARILEWVVIPSWSGLIFPTQGSNPLQANSSPSELPGKDSQIKWLLFFKKWEQNLSEPMDCSLPGSSIHGILQARILEWVAISLSRGSSQPRDQTLVFRTSGRFFTIWATKAARWLLKAEANWNLP